MTERFEFFYCTQCTPRVLFLLPADGKPICPNCDGHHVKLYNAGVDWSCGLCNGNKVLFIYQKQPNGDVKCVSRKCPECGKKPSPAFEAMRKLLQAYYREAKNNHGEVCPDREDLEEALALAEQEFPTKQPEPQPQEMEHYHE